MSDIKVISGLKEDIPAKYLEGLMELIKKNDSQIFQEPPHYGIDYYRNRWTIGENDWKKSICALAIKEEKLIGYGYIEWNIKYDNLDTCYFWVFIDDAERRKGYGTKLTIELLKFLPDEIKKIHTEAFQGTNGIDFVEKMIPEVNFKAICSTSDLTQFDKNKIENESKVEKKKALLNGYDIIYIDQIEFAFHLNVNEFVKLIEEIWNDMPREELSFEDDILTIERFFEMYYKSLLRGDRVFTYVAIHKESGKPIGFTSTHINKYLPEVAYQMDTGVIGPHRGNGLGYALKIQMLNKLLQETQTTQWRTGNAGSNEHMLNINRRLNYKPTVISNVYETTKEKLFTILDIKK